MEENPNNLKNIENAQEIIKTFEKWTTYFFGGFNDNRENVYTNKAISTSIAFRLIHENLPRFIENIKRFEKAKELEVDFSSLEKSYDVGLDEIFSIEYFNQCLTQKGIDKYNLIRGGYSGKNNSKEQGFNEIINETAQQLEPKIKQVEGEQKTNLQTKRKKVLSCKLEKLDKQILSDRDGISFRVEEIKNDAELCQLIMDSFQVRDGKLIAKEQSPNKEQKIEFDIFKSIEKLKACLQSSDSSKVYIKNDVSKEFEKETSKQEGDNSLTIKQQKEIAIGKPLISYFNFFKIKEKKQNTNLWKRLI